MEFSGTFELEETTIDEVWLALSDPVLIEQSLPGCQFLLEVDDTDVDFDELREETADRDVELSGDPAVISERAFREGQHYAALMEISVGPVSPSFETVVMIETYDRPQITATGEGKSANSSFEMRSGMTLSETDDGVAVDWETEADVFGKIAQIGQRMINPVANRVIKRFFTSVQEDIHELTLVEADGDSADDAADSTAASAADQNDDTRGFVDRVLNRSDDSSEE